MNLEQFYDGLIEQYLQHEKNNPHSQVGQLEYYKTLDLKQAIDDAVFGRYIVDDYQYFSYHYKHFFEEENAQVDARKCLLNNMKSLKDAKDFMEIYNEVRRLTRDVRPGKLGLLFFYDTALRIGASEDINLSPEEVFLQRGSEKGALNTGISFNERNYDKPFVKKYKFEQLTSKFKDLDAQDIETLLCIYHREIDAYMKSIFK